MTAWSKTKTFVQEALRVLPVRDFSCPVQFAA